MPPVWPAAPRMAAETHQCRSESVRKRPLGRKCSPFYHLPFSILVFHRSDAGHFLRAQLVVTQQGCRLHADTLSTPHWSLHLVFVRTHSFSVYLSPAAATDNHDLGKWLPGRAGLGPLLIEKPRSREVAVKVSNSGSSIVARLANLPWQS